MTGGCLCWTTLGESFDKRGRVWPNDGRNIYERWTNPFTNRWFFDERSTNVRFVPGSLTNGPQTLEGYASLQPASQGTRQIRVILYAKEPKGRAGRPSPTPNELAIEDVLAVEHDIVPFDGAHVFEQLQVNAVGRRVALADGPGDLSGLPVDDAGEDQRQAAARVHLLPQLAGIDPATPTVKDVPRHRMELLHLE